MEGEGRRNSECWCSYTTARQQSKSSSSMVSFGPARTEFKNGASRVCSSGDEDGGVVPRYGTSRPIMASPDLARPRAHLNECRGGDRDGRRRSHCRNRTISGGTCNASQNCPCGQVTAMTGAAKGYRHGVGGCVVSGPAWTAAATRRLTMPQNSPGDGARNPAHDTYLPISPHTLHHAVEACVPGEPGLDHWAWRRFGSAASE